MSKKINKSSAHCEALISQASKIRACYQAMIKLASEDKSACESERAADIALFARKSIDADRMIAWWKQDIERNALALASKKSADIALAKIA